MFFFGLSLEIGSAQTCVLVDQVGYEINSPKQAIVQALGINSPISFMLIRTGSKIPVFEGKLKRSGEVLGWDRGIFWIADFSSWNQAGDYILQIATPSGNIASSPFEIEDNLLERHTLSSVIFYFKGQRSSGDLDQADRHLPDPEKPGAFVDVHGGWYDATGDYGIHFSHQNPTAFFNPQQVPLVAWSLLKSYKTLLARHDDNFTEYERRMLDEGLFGADFITRMKRPDGAFFESLTAPGKNKLAKDRAIGNPNWRTQIKSSSSDSTENIIPAVGPYAYQTSFRSGGGMAIAALALASTMSIDGDLPRTQYLKSAEEAFHFLQNHNTELLNDSKENIVDDYCALLAATELYSATQNNNYRQVADQRADQLMTRLTSSEQWRNYWRADDDKRPYFHPADAGLPIISLLEYNKIASPIQQSKVRESVERSLRFELAVTSEVNNPFGYARQLVRTRAGKLRTAFFFPHDTEAAPWWQGENARLGSLAAAAREAAPLFAAKPEFQSQLQAYAWNQLHWILGRNPYDSSMLMGTGHNNAAYMFFRSYKYTSAPGAIINGITSALDNEDGIAFNQGYAVTGQDEDWRWTEEWLPHAAWYLYAISLPHP